jgi:uncharacterized membrane protein
MPLRSPLIVLLIPLALERFLSASPFHWGTSFHYSAPVAPILAMSAGDGLARMANRMDTATARSRLIAGVAGASVLLSSLLPGRQPLWRLLSPRHYQETTFERTAYRVLRLIPPDASVVAQAAVMPHISQRHQIYVLGPAAPDADFVIAGAELSPWPAQTRDELEESGWILLRRGPP